VSSRHLAAAIVGLTNELGRCQQPVLREREPVAEKRRHVTTEHGDIIAASWCERQPEGL
jgi:hypothetical protein